MSAVHLKPGDYVPDVSAHAAFDFIIRPDAIKGIDAQFCVVDAQALRQSLLENGQDPSQVDAIVLGDLTLDRFIQLATAESECLKSFGLDVTEVTITDDGLGPPVASYGVSGGRSGYRAGQVAYIQAMCQNRYTGAFQCIYRGRVGPSRDQELTILVNAANAYIACVRRSGRTAPFPLVDASNFDAFMNWLKSDDTPGCHFLRND